MYTRLTPRIFCVLRFAYATLGDGWAPPLHLSGQSSRPGPSVFTTKIATHRDTPTHNTPQEPNNRKFPLSSSTHGRHTLCDTTVSLVRESNPSAMHRLPRWQSRRTARGSLARFPSPQVPLRRLPDPVWRGHSPSPLEDVSAGPSSP